MSIIGCEALKGIRVVATRNPRNTIWNSSARGQPLRHQAYSSPTPRTAHFGARMLLWKDRRIKQTHGTNKRASSKLAIEMKTKTQEEGNVWVLTCESAEDVWELENGESYTGEKGLLGVTHSIYICL
jgi:hypothetical protein